MIEIIKKNFKDIIIIIIGVIVILQTCGKYKPQNEKITFRDTTITTIIHDSFFNTKSNLKNTIIPEKTIIEKYYYDTSSADLKNKYIELAKKFEEINIYNQTIPIDTFGTITINDSINQNKLKNRLINYNLKEKKVFIKETIKLPYEPKRQIYVGGELGGNTLGLTNTLIGLLYKDRRDNIYKLGAGIDISFTLQPQIQIGYYKKL